MRIAIVGSAESLYDRPRGDEIDSHDLVVRCNWGLFYIDKEYTGIHTDAWAYGINKQIRRKINSIKEVCSIWLTGTRHDARFFNTKKELDEKTNALIVMDRKIMDLSKKNKIYRPTTGFLTILMALHLFPKNDINIYGFSKDEDDNINTFSKGKISNKHSLDKERKFLKYHPRVFYK